MGITLTIPRSHDRAAGETAEQPADDDAVVLRAIQAITAPTRLAGGNTFPAPIDGSGFSRMVTPPDVAAEATRREGATDRRRVSQCGNDTPTPAAESSSRSPSAGPAASGVPQ